MEICGCFMAELQKYEEKLSEKTPVWRAGDGALFKTVV